MGCSLVFENVTFQYPETEKPSLSEINFKASANKTIGLVGRTGSGKTTLLDLALGLLRPTSGLVLVDDKNLHENSIPSWHRSIGYVPQQIFLTDDTIAQHRLYMS